MTKSSSALQRTRIYIVLAGFLRRVAEMDWLELRTKMIVLVLPIVLDAGVTEDQRVHPQYADILSFAALLLKAHTKWFQIRKWESCNLCRIVLGRLHLVPNTHLEKVRLIGFVDLT